MVVRRVGWARALLVAAALVMLAGCRTPTPPPVAAADVMDALSWLRRPLEGDPAALYKLQIPSSASLRLAVLVAGNEGRMTVSERFGAALSVTAWTGQGAPDYLDFREGCVVEGADMSDLLGVAVLPMPQAVRLLTGRLPAVADDQVMVTADGRLRIDGAGWSAMVSVRADPWRVIEVEEVAHEAPGWTIVIADHAASVPSELTIRKPGRRRVEIELVRLEWQQANQLPALPELPPCRQVR